jgi:hypothetical protein
LGLRPSLDLAALSRGTSSLVVARDHRPQGGIMRKITLLATAAAAFAGMAAIAFGANTYSVTVAKVSPTKAGTTSKPKPVTISFAFTVGTTDGTRPLVTTDYTIAFGTKIKSNRKFFKGSKTCTLAQAGYSSGASPHCPSASKAGSGTIQNQAGVTNDPTNKIPCTLGLTLFVGDGKGVPLGANDGIAVKNDMVLALKGSPPACPLGVDAAIPAGLVATSAGTALKFHVRKSPFQQPQPGIDNAVVSVSSKTGKSVRVRQKGKLVTRGLFETVGCTGGHHTVQVLYTDSARAVSRASKTAPCTK